MLIGNYSFVRLTIHSRPLLCSDGSIDFSIEKLKLVKNSSTLSFFNFINLEFQQSFIKVLIKFGSHQVAAGLGCVGRILLDFAITSFVALVGDSSMRATVRLPFASLSSFVLCAKAQG